MTDQRYIKTIIYATVAIWTVLLWLDHQTIHATWYKPLSTTITAILTAVMIFDLWAWQWRIWQGWFVKRPVIDGTWKVQIVSNWTDPVSGQPIAPITAFMVVRQTLSTLSMRLLTSESSSILVGTEIVCSTDGLYCVSGVYRNDPWFQFRDRSEIHYGGLWLQVMDDNQSKTIRGHYWTDRKTAGSMVLSGRTSKTFQSFQAAQKHYHNS